MSQENREANEGSGRNIDEEHRQGAYGKRKSENDEGHFAKKQKRTNGTPEINRSGFGFVNPSDRDIEVNSTPHWHGNAFIPSFAQVPAVDMSSKSNGRYKKSRVFPPIFLSNNTVFKNIIVFYGTSPDFQHINPCFV